MSEGDILAIRLFIAAGGITAGTVAMTAAGWKHRYFIRTMFALAIALGVCAIFWPQIHIQLPDHIDERLSLAGANPVYWLGLFAFGMAANYFARRPKLEPQQKLPDAQIGLLPANISAVQFVPSEQKMSLVVTPARGGIKISMFVEISYWTTSMVHAGWSEPARFYLGEMPLRAANVKFSHSVMEFGQEANGWLWEILQTDGSPSGTRPCFIHGKLRATFMFIDGQGEPERFPFLLVRSLKEKDGNGHPVVLTRDDFPPD